MNDPCTSCGFSPSASVVPVADIWLPVDVVSANKLKGNGQGASGWVYRGVRNKFMGALEDALANNPVHPASKRRQVKLTRWYYPGQRPYDYDNLVYAFKPVMDCLRKTNVIVNDNEKWLQATYDQQLEEHGGVSILVEEFVN